MGRGKDNQIPSLLPLHQQLIYLPSFVLNSGSLQLSVGLLSALPTFCPPQLPSQRADHPPFCSADGFIYPYLFGFIRVCLCLFQKGILSTPSFESLYGELVLPKGTSSGVIKSLCCEFLGGVPLTSSFYIPLLPLPPSRVSSST